MASQTVSASSILGDSGMTILIGLVVVFFVLLLLTGVFKLFGFLMSGIFTKKGKSVSAPPAPPVTPAAPPIVGNTAPVTTRPEVQNGIPEETVAAISAAVAAVAPAGVQYAVRSIEKKED